MRMKRKGFVKLCDGSVLISRLLCLSLIFLLPAGWLTGLLACLLACLLLLNQKCNYDLKAFLEAHPKKKGISIKA